MDFLQKFQDHLRAECGLAEETVIAYSRDIDQFIAWTVPTGRIYSAALAEDYLKATAVRFSARTLQRKRVSIMRFYQVLASLGTVKPSEHEIIDPVHAEQQDTLPVYAPDQMQMVFDKIIGPSALRDRAIIRLIVASGLRASEVRSLLVQDVKFSDQNIFVRGKGGIDRVVPTTGECLAALRDYANRWRTRYAVFNVPNFFISREGRPLHRKAVADIVSRATLRAGLPKGTSHTLRRTCGTTMLRNGAPIEVVQRVLGHASLKDTQRYVMITREEVFEAVRRFHPSYQEKPAE